ncbi:MAG: OsmC family protein [Actinomycetota bacterium]|nr:OsmC family protein [Actinomycetota bacterium]
MSQAPYEYTVRGQCLAGGTAELHAGDQVVHMDARWGSEAPSSLPGPAELLASAFAACLMKNLERSSILLGITYRSARVEVRARRQDSPPIFVGVTYEMQVDSDASEHQLEVMHRNLKKFGTVYNTLAAVCEVRGTVQKAEV